MHALHKLKHPLHISCQQSLDWTTGLIGKIHTCGFRLHDDYLERATNHSFGGFLKHIKPLSNSAKGRQLPPCMPHPMLSQCSANAQPILSQSPAYAQPQSSLCSANVQPMLRKCPAYAPAYILYARVSYRIFRKGGGNHLTNV